MQPILLNATTDKNITSFERLMSTYSSSYNHMLSFYMDLTLKFLNFVYMLCLTSVHDNFPHTHKNYMAE